MRFKSIRFFCCRLLFLISCKRNLVNLDYTNAKDEVAPLTNLVFRFDKTLIADSLLNHWDSTKYISFEPAIDGKFRWEHGDELVFSPSTPLLPATNYRATLNSDILQYSKYDHFGNADDIHFHTARIKTGKYQQQLGCRRMKIVKRMRRRSIFFLIMPLNLRS